METRREHPTPAPTNGTSSSAQRQSNDEPTRSGTVPARTDSRRSENRHTRTQSRYADQPTPAPTSNGTTTEPTRSNTTSQPQNLRRRTTIDATTGHWDLGKTIGAGSMGKVKLARNKETGEQVAVKIVPRQSSDGEHKTPAERERADYSKEVRTAREAAIVTLVDHPYICGMRDVIRTNYHWYMLFEYVNGGQMLDYIISHGRLKEKQARKFGRQIASALDYCHRNSIVHRDLKIENILISKTGDIKIIDFGLSNLFSPRNYLKTFCGSLYFAAPELLQAKQYTGPEVDVWSFGIVLYVLVCGKVPFDDQSMPQLHAKIKKGHVEWPPWLTPECKNLISRMLTTNPAERANLQEIMNHPWMVKGFGGPPDNYLTPRKPLQLPLDSAVIEKMTGFDFGTPDAIAAELTGIIESEDYQRAIRISERRGVQQTPEVEKKRGVFSGSLYKRRNSINSRDTLNTPSSEAVQLGQDPVNAFHPLLSIYYLAQEKLKREAEEENPGGLSMPKDPSEKPLKVPNMPSTPEAAYTNTHTHEMAGEKPTGGRSRPRARTHGEDEIQDGLQNLNVNTAPNPTNPTIVEPEQQPKSAVGGIFRRFSTKKYKEPYDRDRERKEKPSHPPPALAAYQKPDLLSPPPTGDSSEEKRPKRSHGLGRSISVNSSDMRRRLSRRGVSEGSAMRPTMTESASSYDQRPSMERRRIRRDVGRTSDVPEETDAELQDDLEGNLPGNSSPTGMKPVYLKGLFSVSTTSNRPLPVIRSDIIRVLKQLGVEYREIKGGFSCKHAPSIKPSAPGEEVAPSGAVLPSSPPNNGHQRKISFGRLRHADKEDVRAPPTPRAKPAREPSYNNSEDESFDEEPAVLAPRPTMARPPGETSTHVQSDLGSNMVLKFEIFIVKVPLLSLHGIQFKKVDGGTWQYKNMAQTILNELKL